MFCKMCGKKIHDDSKFCPYCGAAVGKLEEPAKEQIQETAKAAKLPDNMEIEWDDQGKTEKEAVEEQKENPEQSENHIDVKKSLGPKWMLLPVVVVAVAAGAWIGLGKKSVSKSGQQGTEYTTEAQAQESTETVEEETKLVIPFAEGLEGETSDSNSPEEYILPECDTRMYTKEELSVLSAEELRLARNEIYARHGRMFSAEDLKNYFQSKSWYTPQYEGTEFDAKGDSILNEYEIANRNLIVELEDGTTEKVDYKGNYQFRGEEYIWVKNYYIKDDILYVEGEYCDGVYNPDGEDESSCMEFYTVKNNVVVKFDNNTKIQWDDCKNIYDVKSAIDSRIEWFGETAVCVELDGDHITACYGSWQSS